MCLLSYTRGFSSNVNPKWEILSSFKSHKTRLISIVSNPMKIMLFLFSYLKENFKIETMKIMVQKIVGPKFLSPKIIWPKKIWWVKNKFGSEKLLGSKKVCLRKISNNFGSEENVGPKILIQKL